MHNIEMPRTTIWNDIFMVLGLWITFVCLLSKTTMHGNKILIKTFMDQITFEIQVTLLILTLHHYYCLYKYIPIFFIILLQSIFVRLLY